MELNKENLYNYYIIQNKARKECSEIFNCSEALIVKRLREYGIKKDRQKARENLEKTMMAKYGIKNAAYLDNNNFKVNPPMRNKEIQKRAIETFKKRYNPGITEKRKKTNLERYGTDFFAKSDKFKEKILEKNPNYAIIKSKEKLRNIILELENPTYSNLCAFLGYSYAPVFKAVKENNLENLIKKEYSKTNIYWHDLILEKIGFDFKYEGSIFKSPYEHSDLYLEEKHIAIDINPTITHNTQFNPFHPKNISSIDSKYHFRRAIEAEENGWLLYQIFDWDNEEKIITQLKSLLQINKSIYARECIVKEISKESKTIFLNKYHSQGDVGSDYNYGLYYENSLIAVMTFGITRFTKIADFELLRFCSKGNVAGGASKLFKYFIRNVNPKSVMTYSDMAKGHGNVYKKLGFEFYGYAGLNALYAPLNTKGIAIKMPSASREYQKHKNEFSSCKEYFNFKKWYRIVDAGNKIWLWRNSNYNSENQKK